jgi:hypothetical protein
MALLTEVRHTPVRLTDASVWPAAVAFTGCLTVVAMSSALGGVDPLLGLVALGFVAVATARRARPLVAVVIGALACLFYDGFLADALTNGYQPGALHWHGAASLLALGLLIVVSTAASLSTRALGDTASGRRKDRSSAR